jgi:plastocyanin
MTRRPYALLLVAAMACGGSGDGGGGKDEPARTNAVRLVKSYRFEPDSVTVTAGSTVTWTNEDDFPHDVTMLDGAKEKRPLSIGKSASITFAGTGTFRYQCSIHPQQMKGTVVVT